MKIHRVKLLLLFFSILGVVLLLSACSVPQGDALGQGNTRDQGDARDLEDARDLGENVQPDEIMLPPPAIESDYSLERSIYERLSHRSFAEKPLTLELMGQLLWAAQGKGVDGVTGATRTAPSAGATHPLELYLTVGDVDGLEAGVYRYHFGRHSLVKIAGEDRRERLAAASFQQGFVADAAVSIVLAADYERTTARYGERGARYVYMEVGHSTQNVYLQCGSLGLGAVAVGAFDDAQVKALLEIKEEPLMIIPLGHISTR